MADMHDSGRSMFEGWARQEPAPNGQVFYNRWLGKFNPQMTGEKANRRLDHVGKITEKGQNLFIRGWDEAASKYLRKKLLP